MKKSIPITIILGLFIGAIQLTAAEKWEGSDDFSNASRSKGLWIADNKPAGYMYVDGGRLLCFYRRWDDDYWWYWGRNKNPVWIPTVDDWTIESEVFLPNSAPSDVERVKVGLAVGALEGKKYRSMYLKLYRYFSGGTPAGGVTVSYDSDYRTGKDNLTTQELGVGPTSWILSISHSALNQTDTYRVLNGTTREQLFETSFASPLNIKPLAGVGILVSGKKSWPTGRTDLAADNWSMRQDVPAPLELPSLTKEGSKISGFPWTLTIRQLRLLKGKFSGTARVSFGSQNIDLPVTGSIRTDGLFLLSGKGSKATAGYAFTMLYDVRSLSRVSGSGRLSAPKQKQIVF